MSRSEIVSMPCFGGPSSRVAVCLSSIARMSCRLFLNSMLEFTSKNIIHFNQLSERLHPGLGRNSLGKHIRKAGQETDVVLIVGMRCRAIDLQHPVGRTFNALDQDIDRCDDLVLAIEGRQDRSLVEFRFLMMTGSPVI